MKTRFVSRRVAGFTLVELLVVISIIVVLAAMGLSIGSRVLTRAKQTKTQNDAIALVHGIDDFNREYSRYPDFGAQSEEIRVEGEVGGELLTILLGKEEVGDSMQNKKQIDFATFRESPNKNQGGLVYASKDSGAKPEGLYDSWGNALFLVIDADNNGEVPDPFNAGKVVRETVIAYSFGADGKAGGGDDVKSW